MGSADDDAKDDKIRRSSDLSLASLASREDMCGILPKLIDAFGFCGERDRDGIANQAVKR